MEERGVGTTETKLGEYLCIGPKSVFWEGSGDRTRSLGGRCWILGGRRGEGCGRAPPPRGIGRTAPLCSSTAPLLPSSDPALQGGIALGCFPFCSVPICVCH